MPIPTSISDLSITPALNSPDGSIDIPSSLDDYQRAHAAFIAQLRDEKANISGSVASLAATNWTIQEVGGALYFQYGGVNKFKMTSDGTLNALLNVGVGSVA